MTDAVTGSVREAPAAAAAPAVAAFALFFAWACRQAGYPASQWAPGGLMLLALIVISIGVRGVRMADVPLLVKISLVSLAAFTALSFLSIVWAPVPAEAFEGANRTLLYLLVFALFATWPLQTRSAALLLGGWTLAIVGLAAYVALRVDAATSIGLHGLVPDGRLAFPSGYVNANAAQWLMAFWPAVLLARSGRVPWGLRGLLAGGAVLLAEVALASQSRGSLLAMVAMLVLVFALLRDRTRTFALLLPVAVGIGAAAPAVLAVGDHLRNRMVSPTYVHEATIATFTAAAAVGLLVALGAAIETRRLLSSSAFRRVRRAFSVLALATLLTITVAAVVATGNPVTQIRHSWESFKGGYPLTSGTGSRLVSGLGSNRYDFYRVALDEFVAHPLFGIGADNFQQEYLQHRHSVESPRYPHSIELRALTETGLVGTLLGVIGLSAGLLAGARAARSTSGLDPLASAVAAAALGGFAYWLMHGSVDWFWEIAGLGAPAFALLGLACSLARSAPEHLNAETSHRDRRRAGLRRAAFLQVPISRRVYVGAWVVLALASAASLTAQWIR